MNMRSSLSVLILALAGACGSGGPTLDKQTFVLRVLTPEEAATMIRSSFPSESGKLALRPGGHTITVWETPDNLEKIAGLLAKRDRLATVRLTFRLIEADGATTVDPAIADIEAVLRQLFRFRGYRLAAEAVVSGVEGSQVSQVLTSTTGRFPVSAEIGLLSGRGDSATVHLGVRLTVSLLPPGEFGTHLGIPIGKTAVLGHVAAEWGKKTLILTVRPELVSASP
jgi:hypothetical protein